jgi:ubiquinone biosynthesis protein UbiJ
MTPLIQNLLLTGLEPVVNHALQADPKRDQLLKPLMGKTLAIRLHNPDLVFSILFAKQSMHLLNEYTTDADAAIQTSGQDLCRHVLRPQLVNPQSSLKFDGDALLIQSFWKLCTHFNPQWEHWLAPYLGHVAAYHIGQTGRRTFSWAQMAITRLTHSTADYLQFDAKWWVSRREAEEFFSAVDHLRLSSERLEMRLARLIKPINASSQDTVTS